MSTSPDRVLNGEIDEFLEKSLYQLNEKIVIRAILSLSISIYFCNLFV